MKNLYFPLFLCLLLTLSVNANAQLNNESEQIETEKGELTIHPILHGTVALEWDGKTIYVDPYGGADRFSELPDPDLILITHPHGDHLHPETLSGLNTSNATFIVPESVAEELPSEYEDQVEVYANGESTEYSGISLLTLPMYNLDEEEPLHPKGWGNGYLLTMGGKNIYISGDTEDITEMRALTDIDVAFVCMNLPYTMDIRQAASAVLEFEPEIVYPYHHRGQDIEEFKAIVDAAGKDIDVRLKDWYTEN